MQFPLNGRLPLFVPLRPVSHALPWGCSWCSPALLRSCTRHICRAMCPRKHILAGIRQSQIVKDHTVQSPNYVSTNRCQPSSDTGEFRLSLVPIAPLSPYSKGAEAGCQSRSALLSGLRPEQFPENGSESSPSKRNMIISVVARKASKST